MKWADCKFLLRLAKVDRRLLVLFGLASVVRAALAMGILVLMQQFLVGVLGGERGLAGYFAETLGRGTALWVVAGMMLACYFASSLLTYQGKVMEQQIVRVFELGVLDRLTAHLLSLSVGFLERQSHGDLIQAMRLDVMKAREAASSLVKMAIESALAIGFVGGAIWASPRLSLYVFVGLPLVTAPVLTIARRAVRRSFVVRRLATALYDGILQILRGIRVIKVYRGEESERQRMAERARQYFEASIEIAKVESGGQLLLEAVAGLGIVAAVISGGFQVLGGSLTWPSLMAFLMAVRSAHGPLSYLNAAFLDFQTNTASVARIGSLLAERPEIEDAPGARELKPGPQSLCFENVSFAYRGKPVLQDLSFEIGAGETLGIAGPSGCGKTTLLSLVARFFDPTRGRIRMGGVDLREIRLADLHCNLALVPQPPFLFAASGHENIRCGRPSATDVEVMAAARAAEIHEEIAALPAGYETILGPGGRAVSEGQSQRINVARALLKDASVLLLDEATSSLDSISEARLQAVIGSAVRGRTTLVVAHRLSTLRHATRILVLENGRCAGLGTHSELMHECPLYREMWLAQSHSPGGPAAGLDHHPQSRPRYDPQNAPY